MRYFIYFILIGIIIGACEESKKEPKLKWEVFFPNTGSFSSPRSIDLNGDGVEDIVLGAGGREWHQSDNGVLAIDGKTGEILWRVKSRNQMIGSPLFLDINSDSTADIIIGGRSAQLIAINGLNGSILWEYQADNDTLDYQNDTTLLNFFTPQLIPDQDGDGLEDILVSFGGYVKAMPYDDERPSGLLKVISSKDGTLIASALMPDNKETYMTAIYFKKETNGKEYILFGTGGETIQGNLFLARFDQLLAGSLQEANVIVNGFEKGFIAPPVRVDLNDDGILDIVVNAFEGRTIAIDGNSYEIIWEVNFDEEFETSSMPIPFYFDKDGYSTLAIFCDFGKGTWPEIHHSEQFILHGLTGEILNHDSVGNFQFSSALLIENQEDKKQILLRSINLESLNNEPLSMGNGLYKYTNTIWISDFYNQNSYSLFPENFTGSNPGSTPFLKDIDNNGKLDLIYLFMNNPYDMFEFKGMTIKRYELSFSGNWKTIRNTYLPE